MGLDHDYMDHEVKKIEKIQEHSKKKKTKTKTSIQRVRQRSKNFKMRLQPEADYSQQFLSNCSIQYGSH